MNLIFIFSSHRKDPSYLTEQLLQRNAIASTLASKLVYQVSIPLDLTWLDGQFAQHFIQRPMSSRPINSIPCWLTPSQILLTFLILLYERSDGCLSSNLYDFTSLYSLINPLIHLFHISVTIFHILLDPSRSYCPLSTSSADIYLTPLLANMKSTELIKIYCGVLYINVGGHPSCGESASGTHRRASLPVLQRRSGTHTTRV